MLQLINVSKSFPGRGQVLDNLSLDISSGESISVTGPSGSGKSTLMNIIGALDRPDSGEVIFEGRSLAVMSADDLAAYRNRNIGFVFQDHLLLKHLTILENIMLPLIAGKITDEVYSEKEKYAVSLMDHIGISDLSYKFPAQVSGGEAQRASLVRALITQPSLLLADEPTGSLDTKNADLLGSLLVSLNKEMNVTLIVVTHSEKLASKMDRQFRLADGKLLNQ